jgi:hypothetical protein
MPNQMHQQVEYLGLDGHQGSAPVQFASICVEYTILEEIAQEGGSGPIAR